MAALRLARRRWSFASFTGLALGACAEGLFEAPMLRARLGLSGEVALSTDSQTEIWKPMQERRWKGRYFDGKTSRVRPAKVTVSTMGLEVSIGGKPSDLWPYQEIRRTQGFTPGE